MDEGCVARSAVGLEELRAAVAGWTPRRAAEACGLRAAEIEAAAELLGTCEALTSTVLQGVYQSHQATATACQINNVHLLRGMLGRGPPSCR